MCVCVCVSVCVCLCVCVCNRMGFVNKDWTVGRWDGCCLINDRRCASRRHSDGRATDGKNRKFIITLTAVSFSSRMIRIFCALLLCFAHLFPKMFRRGVCVCVCAYVCV